MKTTAHMVVLYVFLSALLCPQIPEPYALEYKVESITGDYFRTQYIVIREDEILFTGFGETYDGDQVVMRFSYVDSTVSMTTIHRRSQRYVCVEFSMQEYRDSKEIRTVQKRNNNSTVDFFHENQTLEFTAYLTNSLPNVHPMTIMYPEIDRLPVRIERKDRIHVFSRLIRNPVEIDRIMDYCNTDGYTALNLNMHDLKALTLEMTGMTFEQFGEHLKSTRQDE